MNWEFQRGVLFLGKYLLVFQSIHHIASDQSMLFPFFFRI